MAAAEPSTNGAALLASPEWRLNNLYTITDKAGNEIPFRPNEAQRLILPELHSLNVVLKARQRGFTTLFCLVMLDVCLFNDNVRAAIVAQTDKDVEFIFRDKVKFPYEKLLERFPDLKGTTRAHQDSAKSLLFSNNSQLRVGTNLRGGTFQWLLITEYGKICAKYPERMREIRTGALNTVQAGQFITIESTAEGQEGHFFDICNKAQAAARRGDKLTDLDFKFHFFPWYDEPEYRLDPDGVAIPQEMADYFQKLEDEHGIVLDAAQRAWYVKKADQQQEDMRREFPSTPEEAFEAAVEGAIFGAEIARAERDKRICHVPIEAGVPVNTFWDIGQNDDMVIWLHQRVGPQNRFIGFYRNSGEPWAHYKRWLDDFAVHHNVSYGRHFGPHDLNQTRLGAVRSKTNKEIAAEAGIRFENAVPRCDDLWADVQTTRGVFGSCWFDIERCSEGVGGLKMYRKEWDEKLGAWKNRPRHDQASHVADAFRTFARGYQPDSGGYPLTDWSKPLAVPMSIA